MLNPSYSSLMKILNEDAELDQKITSRYSVVIAAAKRARQIVAGAEYSDLGIDSDKAVSIAVNEIYHGHVRIVPKDAPETWESAVVHNVPILIDDNFLMEAIDGFEADDFEDSAEGFDDADDDWKEQDGELLGHDADDEDADEPEDE